MHNKISMLLLVGSVTITLGCSNATMGKNFGNSVKKNTVLQTVNLSAPQESHGDVKMDGQKAAKVVEDYRKESPKAEDADLTK